MKYPEKRIDLKIGVASISDGVNEKMNYVFDYLNNKNISVSSSDFLFASKNLVSANAQTRANSFLEMWNDKNINYIISAFGGEFCMEILQYIYNHPDSFKINKKWFQGFSDSNFLTYFLTTNYNLATINYYNAEDYGSNRNLKYLEYTLNEVSKFHRNYSFVQENSDKYIEDYSRKINDNNLGEFKTIPKCSSENVCFSGRLIGGWIEAISTLCGTKYDNTKNFCEQFEEGVIWYIDNCELSSPMLRRKLWQMYEAGYFNNCNGVLIGREPDDDFSGDYNFNNSIIDTFQKLNIPVIEDVDIGHFFPQWLIVNGSFAEVNYNNGKVKILQRLK